MHTLSSEWGLYLEVLAIAKLHEDFKFLRKSE